MVKCPFCGNNTADEIKPSTGTSYVLTEVNANKTPAEFIPTSGLPIQVVGCLTCKRVHFLCPSIRKE
jgi:hypothetical protein|nr:MAG TPA: nucleic-acid-binding protein [Caudoviricetes sp.]